MVYQFFGCLCYTKRIFFFFFIVVLHNSVHYASDATLNERNETVLCSYRIGHRSLHATGIKEQLPFLCNTD